MDQTKYTKYDAESGDIICHFESFPEHKHLNEPCIEGHWDWDTYRVVGGVATPKSASEIEEQDISREWVVLRGRRNRLLSGTDWTQVPDAPVDAAAWAVYRQQLRDLPANTTDPRNVVWPVPPS
jgi:hypothetical protein